MKISKSKLLSLLTSVLLCLTLVLGPAGAPAEAAGSVLSLKPGESAMLEIEGIDYAEWYSTDPDVCVCYNGFVVATGEGTAEVCAAFDGIVLKCTVKVSGGSGSGSKNSNKNSNSDSGSSSSNGKTVNVQKGKSTVITVKSASRNLKFKYSGTKAISLSVSYDKSKGEYHLTVKGKANGTAKITAYEKNNSKNKTEINVTVSDKASTKNAVFTVGSSSGSTKADNTDSSGSKSSDYADEVIRLVNEERESRGIPKLTKDDALCKNATTRVNELSEKFSHTRPNGKSCFTAITVSHGYAGENIAAGQRNPDEVMDSWMNSSGHRSNILSRDYTKIGVAYDPSGNYWVQIFISD